MSQSETRGVSTFCSRCIWRKRRTLVDDAVEHVFAADHLKSCWLGGVERDAEFVEAGIDERLAVLLGEQGSIGVEEDVDGAVFEITDHLGQVFDEHWLADSVEHRALEAGGLVDDAGEEFPGHVFLGL